VPTEAPVSAPMSADSSSGTDSEYLPGDEESS